MKYNKATLNRWIDIALERYGVTISQIEEDEGKVISDKKLRKKGKDPYYITYPFENEEHYQKWKDEILKEMKKLNPEMDKEALGMEFDFVDALIGLSQLYLFKTENYAEHN